VSEWPGTDLGVFSGTHGLMVPRLAALKPFRPATGRVGRSADKPRTTTAELATFVRRKPL
jgi:hypothetical protein